MSRRTFLHVAIGAAAAIALAIAIWPAPAPAAQRPPLAVRLDEQEIGALEAALRAEQDPAQRARILEALGESDHPRAAEALDRCARNRSLEADDRETVVLVLFWKHPARAQAALEALEAERAGPGASR